MLLGLPLSILKLHQGRISCRRIVPYDQLRELGLRTIGR